MFITNFASGELGRNLKGRVDLQQYYQCAQTLRNFSIIPTGGIQRRAGFRRIGSLHGAGRLIPFIFDKGTSFVLEFTPGTLFFWKNGEPYLDTGGNQIQLEIPYASIAELRELQYVQNYDTFIFCHRNYPPQILKYDFALKIFTLAPMEFDFYADVNVDDDYGYILIADENGLPTADFDGQYCVYNGQLWKWSEADKTWEVDGDDPEADDGLFTTSGNYPGACAFFNNRLYLASTDNARQRVWASATPDTKNTRYNEFSSYQKYVTVSKVVKDPDLHIFTGNVLTANINSALGTTTITGVTQNLLADGVLTKDAAEYYIYNSSYVPAGTKVQKIAANSITIGYVIDTEEDLNAIVFQMSLWRDPTSASADDYEYSVTNQNSVTSDCSFYFELASDQNDAIKWLAANKYLTIGTENSVYCAPSGINALSISVEMAGRYGSDEIQGLPLGTAVIFFNQGKCGIREFYYDASREDFITNNIAILAEQMLTESPCLDFDFMTNPYNRILCTREDGTIAVMLYDKVNGVMGWYRVEHGAGEITSTAVTRGDAESDFVYCAVKDGDSYYLETLNPADKVFLDSWRAFDGDTDGYSESAVLYNATKDEMTSLADYSEDFISEGDDVYIGYEYTSLIESMPVIADDMRAKKRIVRLLVRFDASYMPHMVTTDRPDELFTGVAEPYSGIAAVDYPGTSGKDITFELDISKPKPCTILCVNAEVA